MIKILVATTKEGRRCAELFVDFENLRPLLTFNSVFLFAYFSDRDFLTLFVQFLSIIILFLSTSLYVCVVMKRREVTSLPQFLWISSWSISKFLKYSVKLSVGMCVLDILNYTQLDFGFLSKDTLHRLFNTKITH